MALSVSCLSGPPISDSRILGLSSETPVPDVTDLLRGAQRLQTDLSLETLDLESHTEVEPHLQEGTNIPIDLTP
jgi:hypothetical protein